MGTRSRGLPRTEVKARVLGRLRADSEGETALELAASIGETSLPTVRRAVAELADVGAIHREPGSNKWRLRDTSYHLALDAPELGDLQAVLIAEALLASLAEPELRDRLRSLAEQIDERVRQRHRVDLSTATAPIDVSLTAATRVHPNVLTRLLASLRCSTVSLEYIDPWNNRTKHRLVEPWQLRLHGMEWYLRAFDRKHDAPRTFRIAHILRVVNTPGTGPPRAPVPGRDQLWGDGDPAYGIDHDHPDTAVVVIAPPLSRWLEPVIWNPRQRDRWLPGDRLERTVDYQSCREFARVVRSVSDGLESVEPARLRTAVFG